MFGRKGRSINYQSQAAELSALKAEFPWLAKDCFSQCLQQALKDLETAYRNFFAGRAGYPSPRKKFINDAMRFPQAYESVKTLPDGTKKLGKPMIVVGRDRIKLPKFGWIPYVRHRRPKGILKSATVSKEGDYWYISLLYEEEIKDLVIGSEKATALDYGVEQPLTEPNGNIIALPRVSPAERKKLAKLQRKLARTKKGSNGRKAAKSKVRCLTSKFARRREDGAHKATTDLVKSHDMIAIEALKMKNMTASAAGTVEAPGTNVRAKAGLNRSLLDINFGRIRQFLDYKGKWYGCRIEAVPAQYSSQACPQCNCINKENRPSRSVFKCIACGYTGNADAVAAQNILNRAYARLIGEAVRQLDWPVGIPVIGRQANANRRRQRQSPCKSQAAIPIAA
jgi:putative transposase